MSDDTRSRPILFSGPMVQALLDGRKTQTRRIVSPAIAETLDFYGENTDEVSISWGQAQDDNGPVCRPQWLAYSTDYPEEGVTEIGVGYGAVGDLLWVRETWRVGTLNDEDAPRDIPKFATRIAYEADGSVPAKYGPGRVRPSIHMPRWASRITLRLTDVRVERLQEISEPDALAEGVTAVDFRPDDGFPWCTGYMVGKDDGSTPLEKTAAAAFKTLWNSINARRGYGWDANPWVWALTFEVFQKNVDSVTRTLDQGKTL